MLFGQKRKKVGNKLHIFSHIVIFIADFFYFATDFTVSLRPAIHNLSFVACHFYSASGISLQRVV